MKPIWREWLGLSCLEIDIALQKPAQRLPGSQLGRGLLEGGVIQTVRVGMMVAEKDSGSLNHIEEPYRWYQPLGRLSCLNKAKKEK